MELNERQLLSIDEQIRFHRDRVAFHEGMVKKLLGSAEYCGKCNRYFLKDFGTEDYHTVEGTYVEHTACEFDDAAIYDCTYLIKYHKCPICGGLNEVSREPTDLRNKHYAGQTLKWSW